MEAVCGCPEDLLEDLASVIAVHSSLMPASQWNVVITPAAARKARFCRLVGQTFMNIERGRL